MSKGKYYFSKSLEKGLKILSLFNRETPVLTQSEIAKTLDMNMTSTYRYINTLVELGYLEKDAKTKEIRPSTLCLLFCTNLMRATDHLKMIKEVVDRIHRENNISIDVVFVVDDTLVRIYHREAEETLTYSLPDFSKNCLHNTALGKAYLSSLPDDLIAEKIDKMVLVAKTEKTIVDKRHWLPC
jgi:DNA-binding IclR family transcriptional regulator